MRVWRCIIIPINFFFFFFFFNDLSKIVGRFSLRFRRDYLYDKVSTKFILFVQPFFFYC